MEIKHLIKLNSNNLSYQKSTVIYTYLGHIPYGLPRFDWPEFSNKDKSFLDIIFVMGSGIIVLPLISLLEDISLCKLFGKIRVS